jgi:hypothetical protein
MVYVEPEGEAFAGYVTHTVRWKYLPHEGEQVKGQ